MDDAQLPSLVLPRAAAATLLAAADRFPAVLVTGARQTGKSTLLRTLFPGHRVVDFDAPEVEARAVDDPRLFLAATPPPLILDEIQRAPVLLRYVKEAIDRDRHRPGQFLLTGSQTFAVMAGVTESLAGRVAILQLDTLSAREQDGEGAVWGLPPTAHARRPGAPMSRRLLRGGFPELWARGDDAPALWFESYLQTYLERDVRQLRQVGDLRDFRRFLVALAARAGQLLNLSEVARDLGVAVNTAKAWLSVLEAGRQVYVVSPFARNLTKRLVKTPKVYFADTGLLCHLLGLRTPEAVMASAIGGSVFENLVYGELRRAFEARGLAPDVTFFRSADGLEVDFLLHHEGRLFPIEVKRAATPRREMADGILRVRALLGPEVADGLVVLVDGEPTLLAAGVVAAGFDAIA